jgi:hypothetical protein
MPSAPRKSARSPNTGGGGHVRDGKGVVTRPDALRPSTAQAAAKTKPKLHGRLSKED